MKKIILIIVLIFSGVLIAQSWNNIVTTTINEPNLVQLDNFTNRDGIHVVVQNSNATNSIKYYRLTSSGGVLTTTTIETTGGAEFPNIAGDNDHMFISYRLGNNIVTKKYNYSNGTWVAQSSISLNNHDCNSVDNAYNDAGLHIVFSEFDGSNSYITHYWSYASSTPSNHFVVNNQNDYFGQPTISLSANKAHVGFYGNSGPQTRDKNFTTNQWESIQTVASANGNERVQSGCNKLFDFYDVLQPGIRVELYVKSRDINGSTWSSPQLLNNSVNPYPEGRITSTVTSDGSAHILYSSNYLFHRSYNCTSGSWSNEEPITGYIGFTESSSIASASNDLFVIYRKASGFSSYLKYRQYDAVPLAPQNLTVSKSANNHPLLSWNPNTEPDRNYYIVYKSTGGWHQIAQTNGTSYEDVTESYCTAVPPQQCQGGHYVYYYVKAMDLGNNLSDQSNTVGTYVNGALPDKISADPETDVPDEYSLSQNYPNPFNPATRIDYQIKDKGFVSLKVFDMLGREVANLVNETKNVGQYSVEFNANKLPSCVYIYSLRVNAFVQIKKMTILK